jgi:hypothetical protein
MNRELRFTSEAQRNLKDLQAEPAKAAEPKQVRKTLGLMETNLQHLSLNTHKYDSISGPNGEEVFEAYGQNKTPGAYPDRIERKKRIPVLTVIAITRHP